MQPKFIDDDSVLFNTKSIKLRPKLMSNEKMNKWNINRPKIKLKVLKNPNSIHWNKEQRPDSHKKNHLKTQKLDFKIKNLVPNTSKQKLKKLKTKEDPFEIEETRHHLDTFFSNYFHLEETQKMYDANYFISLKDHKQKCQKMVQKNKVECQRKQIDLSLKFAKKIDRIKSSNIKNAKKMKQNNKRTIGQMKSKLTRQKSELNIKIKDFERKKKRHFSQTKKILQNEKEKVDYLEEMISNLVNKNRFLKSNFKEILKSKYVPGHEYKENKDLVNDFDKSFIGRKIRNHVFCSNHQIKTLENCRKMNHNDAETSSILRCLKNSENLLKSQTKNKSIKPVSVKNNIVSKPNWRYEKRLDEDLPLRLPGQVKFQSEKEEGTAKKFNDIEVKDLKNKLFISDVLNLPYVCNFQTNIVYEDIFEKSDKHENISQRKKTIQRLEMAKNRFQDEWQKHKDIHFLKEDFDCAFDHNGSIIKTVSLETINEKWNKIYFDFDKRIDFLKRLDKEANKDFLIKEYDKFLDQKYKRSKLLYELIRKRNQSRIRVRELIQKKMGYYLASSSVAV